MVAREWRSARPNIRRIDRKRSFVWAALVVVLLLSITYIAIGRLNGWPPFSAAHRGSNDDGNAPAWLIVALIALIIGARLFAHSRRRRL